MAYSPMRLPWPRNPRSLAFRVAGNSWRLLLLRLNRKEKLMVCEVRSRLQRHQFGAFLSEAEKIWLVDEIQLFLEKQKARTTLT